MSVVQAEKAKSLTRREKEKGGGRTKGEKLGMLIAGTYTVPVTTRRLMFPSGCDPENR